MEEATEAPGLVGRFGCLDPCAHQRLALVVGEDVQPRERILDGLQPLRCDVRRIAPDLAQVREHLVVRGPVGVPAHGGLVGRRLETLAGLGRQRSRNHDVLLFHLLSPEELNFEFKRHTLYRFVGLENAGTLTVDPRAVTILARRKDLSGEGVPRIVKGGERFPLEAGRYEIALAPSPAFYAVRLEGSGLRERGRPGGWYEVAIAFTSSLKLIVSGRPGAVEGRIADARETFKLR